MKLDWFSCVIQKASISEIASLLGLDFPAIVRDIENEIANQKRAEFFVENARGGLVFRCFDYHNISFKLRNADWKLLVLDGFHLHQIDIFNTICDEILLDISGSGLEYLRSIHNTIDDMLMTEDIFGYQDDDKTVLKAHITRCDIAYDFVNCHENDFDQMYRELGELQFNRCEIIPSVGSSASCQYSLKIGGSERTIYLGTPRSKRLLRIYDKKLERTKKDKNNDFSNLYFTEAEKSKDSSFTLDSWFRIEYQLRREYAAAALYGCGGDLQRVMREICKRYNLAYPKGLSNHIHMEPIQCFKNVFCYEGLTQIGLNNHFCTIRQPDVIDRIKTFEERNFVMICMSHIYHCTVPAPWVNDRIIQLYNSDEHTDKCRYRSLKHRLCDFMMSSGFVSIEETGVLYYNSDGIIQFRSDRVLTEEETDLILKHFNKEALESKIALLKYQNDFFRFLFDRYIFSVGGLENDKLMQGVINDTVSVFRFNPLLDSSEGGISDAC